MKSIFRIVLLVSMVLLLFGPVSVADAAKGCCVGDCGRITPVPEPATFILFGSMLIGALVVKKVITWDR